MAETKTKAASRAANSRARSNLKRASSQNATRRSSNARSRNRRPTSARSPTQKKRSNASNRARAGQGRPESVIVKATNKAKLPAIAAGAALAGVAGGMALGRNGKARGMNLLALRSRESIMKLLGSGAKEVGKAGYQVGQLTSEVRKVREAVSANSEH